MINYMNMTSIWTFGIMIRREFIHSSGARLAVDTVSYDLIKGSTVDFEESLVRTGFVVSKNPNAAASCSCGTSFTAKSSNPYDYNVFSQTML